MSKKLFLLVILLFISSCQYERKQDPIVIKQVNDRENKAFNECQMKLSSLKAFDVVRIKGLEEKHVIETCSCGSKETYDDYVSDIAIDNPTTYRPVCYFVNGGSTVERYGRRSSEVRNAIPIEFLELVK